VYFTEVYFTEGYFTERYFEEDYFVKSSGAGEHERKAETETQARAEPRNADYAERCCYSFFSKGTS
jgi:hypothetical protein